MDVLVGLRFQVHRGFKAEGAVAPRPVVKDFDPFEDGGAGFGPGGERKAVDQFPFQGAPEAFPHRVVIAVAPAAHAGDDARLGEALPVGGAGILNALIGVMHQSGRWPAMLQGHGQRGQRQGRGQRGDQPAWRIRRATRARLQR